MSNIEKVSIALTSEQVATLRAAVDEGAYATTSEAVREAIRDWQLKRELQQEEIRRVRQLWQEGVDSGSAGEVDFDALRQEAKKRIAARRKVKADAD